MRLQVYNKKRKFENTIEPKGKISTTKKLRFVIQHHFARKEHFDFRLEHKGVLISFAVPKGLPEKEGEKHLAVHVEDHPVDYITFKGEIPKGNYGAGKVAIFDKGTYLPLKDMNLGLKTGHIKVELKGKKYSGIYNLIKTDEPNWFVFKSSQKDSISIPKKIKNPFKACNVKLAKLSSTIPIKNYVYEIKYDGYRIVGYIDNNVVLKTRNNKDYTKKFSSIVQSLQKLQKSMILDGEIVAFDKDGRSDFVLLAESIKSGKENFVYVVFDILAYDGQDLKNKPLLERKEILSKALENCEKNIIISEYTKTNGRKCFEVAKKLGLEGIVAKEVNSKYDGNRDENWLKIKCYKRQEFVVAGFSISEKNKDLSAIYVGYYKDKKLLFAGKVGTGFNDKQRKELNQKFSKTTRRSSPFESFDDKDAIWITPKFVAEIQYVELTKNKILRQPSFVGLRMDKPAKNVFLEDDHE